MRILVTGASGLIGAQVCAALLASGHEVVGVARRVAAARRRAPAVHWVSLDLGAARAEDWRGPLAGVSAVVNCAGALQDGPGDDLEAVHLTGPLRLAEACVAAGVRRFIQVSAAGADEAPGRFAETKAAGDAALAGLDLDWVVLRPGLVLSPTAYGGSALLRGLAAFPGFIPAAHAGAVVQVISAGDLARAVTAFLEPDAPARLTLDLAAEAPTRLADVLSGLRGWMGLPPAPVIALPAGLAAAAARVADGLAWLGWRSPMRSTSLAQLAHGVRAAPSPVPAELGVAPRGLEVILSTTPAGVQDLWFARLYLLKPLVLGGLAAFWIASGLIGLARLAPAEALLLSAGFSGAAAKAAVVGGAAGDILAGALVLHRKTARLGLWAMIALTFGYLAGASVWRPDLWLDPLGPMLKTLPAAILALAALAILEDR